MATWTLSLPRLLWMGAGVSLKLPEMLATLGLSRPLIVTDSYMRTSGRLAPLVERLTAAGCRVEIFADTVPEPTAASIDAGVRFVRATDADCVVGFGGGSCIDSAKAIAVLARHSGDCRDLKAPHVQDVAGLPILAIPTTAGTGSEATRFTIITDETSDEKMLCAGLAYLPLGALVDYELTLTMPPRLTADTGIDALTHAIEAYVSRKANPSSDDFALKAMAAIAPNLRRVWSDPADHAARERMMFGSTYAGIAFSNSSVALVHGMSRPIGAHFHVPHGLSNAMLLPAVTAFSAPAALRRYADCARAMGLSSDSEGDQSAVVRLVEELRRLNDDLHVPTPLAYGIDRGKWDGLVPTMIEQALGSGSPGNNPVIPTPEQMEAIYHQLWE